jgi:cytochrome o ubiquinol oxidase operon protein cyoD
VSDTPPAPTAPGTDHHEPRSVGVQVLGYFVGLVLAVVLTAISFYIVHSPLIWTPGIPMGLVVLAVAQMGVHLVFFLHLNTGPDSANTVLALAFGLLITFLVIAGSLFIMTNLDHHMLPMDQVMRLQR